MYKVQLHERGPYSHILREEWKRSSTMKHGRCLVKPSRSAATTDQYYIEMNFVFCTLYLIPYDESRDLEWAVSVFLTYRCGVNDNYVERFDKKTRHFLARRQNICNYIRIKNTRNFRLGKVVVR